MRPLHIKSVLLFGILIAAGCKKVISVNLNNASPQIVIQGNVTNTPGPYQVQISQTVNFSALNVFPAVSGATVEITDNTLGKTDLLTETSPGIYLTHSIQGIPGHTYSMNVNALGQTFTASSTMPQPVTLDSLSFINSSLFGQNMINVVVNFQDPPTGSHFYTFVEYVNSRMIPTTYVFNDRLSSGKYISQQIFADSSYISAADTVGVQMNCVDQNVWNYFNTLGLNITGNNAQSVSPANPLSNISNNALGYFNAGTVMYKSRIAK